MGRGYGERMEQVVCDLKKAKTLSLTEVAFQRGMEMGPTGRRRPV